MIVLSRVHKQFGPVHALTDLSLSVPAGQVVGLLGPNGAGKTTTIRLLTGYLTPTSGSVSVAGYDTTTQNQYARTCLGYLPETSQIYPEMSVLGYLRYRGALFNLRGRHRTAAIDRVLDRCALRDVRDRTIGRLSKGYRQRVGLAAALLHDPPVLILDEPASGLDPAQIRQMRDLIRDLAQRHTVLVSSHILPEVQQTCDRIVILARGRLRADGTPDDLLRSAESEAPYLAEVLPAADRPDHAPAALADRLSRVPGVARLDVEPLGGEASAGWVRVSATPEPGAPDLRRPLAEALLAAGLPLRELTRRTPSLEEVFMRLIEDEGSAAHLPPAPGLAAPAPDLDAEPVGLARPGAGDGEVGS